MSFLESVVKVKNKKWRPYATVTAAACDKEHLSVIPAAEVGTTRPVNGANKDTRYVCEPFVKTMEI